MATFLFGFQYIGTTQVENDEKNMVFPDPVENDKKWKNAFSYTKLIIILKLGRPLTVVVVVLLVVVVVTVVIFENIGFFRRPPRPAGNH